MYIAHFRSSDGEIQTVREHLLETKLLAEQAGAKLDLLHVAGLTALFHDFGKISPYFQRYINEAHDNPTKPPKRGSVDHSTAGAQYLWKMYAHDFKHQVLLESICNAIVSHHSQLLDFVDLEGESPFNNRLNKEIEYLDEMGEIFYAEIMNKQLLDEYVEAAKQEFLRYLKRLLVNATDKALQKRIALTMLNKFLYSILIDSDRLNARQFEENSETPTPPDTHQLFSTAVNHLDNYLKEKQQTSLPNRITELRQEMSNQCYEKSIFSTGIYTLSIPTGGGKTLASLRFALNHALHHEKQRIIYVIPFTTIIEQNAKEVCEILQMEDILEHHSNVAEFNESANDLTYEEREKIRKLEAMKDNWDAPIIFTTFVQFLNTIFNGKARNLRRLHNLANSILIFDEVQSLPVNCVSLFNTAIQFLKDNTNTTTILCTATQPALEFVQHNLTIDGELIDNLPAVVKAFKRTNVQSIIRSGGWNTEQLADFVDNELAHTKNILVVMNNKSVVRKLYEVLTERGIETYHLSTAMCPAHRKKIIQAIRDDLPTEKQFVCVSTQLIEAGVDVSFDCVMRSLAGLDSIAQSAGRCNRHGEAELKNVYVFNHAEENISRLQTIQEGAKCASFVLEDLQKDETLYDGDVLSPAAITYYFQQYYTNLHGQLDYPIDRTSLWQLLYGLNEVQVNTYEKATAKQRYPFANRAAIRSAAQHFRVIDAETTPILVPYDDEGKSIIADLTSETFIDDVSNFMKKAQQYTVNVFPYVKELLYKNGLITIVDLGFMQVLVAKEGAYDEHYGLDALGEAKFEEAII